MVVTGHGGALDAMRAAYPDAPQPWIDLSTGINPWPYPTDAVTAGDWARLPMRAEWLGCRAAIAAAFGADAAAVLPVPGSELAIRLLPTILPMPSTAIVGPTYADHAAAWGTRARIVASVEAAVASDAALVVLCNPNNPDGRTLDRAAMLALYQQLAFERRWLVVDEAYVETLPGCSIADLAGQPRLIVLRSFGKFYGLAGLRLGAVLGPAAVIEGLAGLLGEWAVSGPALRIGAAAYRDAGWRQATRARLEDASRDLAWRLGAAGMRVVRGTPLFQYARADDAGERWERLARAGVYVRRFAERPEYLRFGLPPDAVAAERLSRALVLT